MASLFNKSIFKFDCIVLVISFSKESLFKKSSSYSSATQITLNIFPLSLLHAERSWFISSREEADYGIFLVKDVDSLPKSAGWWSEYNGHRLVCALGNKESDGSLHEQLLCIAYKWAKSKLTLESQKEKRIDPLFVSQQIDAVESKLSTFNMVLKQCDTIESSSKQIRDNITKTIKEIKNMLDGILPESPESNTKCSDQ